MARTLIETPFPTTAEVAKKLGLSDERVRSIERMVFPGAAVREFAAHKKGPGNGRKTLAGQAKVPLARV